MKAKRFLILAIGLLLSHSVSVLFADKPSFRGIGNLQGTSDGWMAISADGLTAVGYRQLESDSYEAFYWTESSGIIGLGYLPGGNLSTAAGVSEDGSVVVGYSTSSLGGQAFCWTEDEGMVGLNDLPGGRFYSTAYNVSADGSVVVGFSGSESAVDYEAFRWTASNGMIGLGDLPGGEYESRAYAVSADGLVVVGYSKKAPGGDQAFRWTESEGMSGLGYLWLGGFSQAYGISPDGSVVVGRASVSNGAVAFRWTDAEGMVSLGDLPGGSVSGTAYDASTNGSIIVGMSNSFNDFEAFIWDEDNGIRSLQDLLINNYHLDLTGWHLRCAYGISDDGTIIVGSGENPQGQREGWIAVLTELEPAIIYVDDDAAGANDGSSWADAFNYLQDALTAAWSGDEIRVAQGTYKPDQGVVVTPGDREATFQLINGVTIKGGYAGAGTQDPNARDIELYKTILSGDLEDNDVEIENFEWQILYDFTSHPSRDENSYTVVTGNGTDTTAVLDGFTITAGHANNPNADFGSPANNGGGMYNESGSPTLINCTFRINTIQSIWASAGTRGGGMYNSNSSPTLRHCYFIENIVFSGNVTSYGGGMFNINSHPTLTNCVFRRNVATGFDDHYWGGAIANSDSNPTLEGCSFIENLAYYGGGGALTLSSGTGTTLTNCKFIGNVAGDGGAICGLGQATLTNCAFHENVATDDGGAIFTSSRNPTLANCTFSRNSAQKGGSIFNGYRGSATLIYCVFKENSAGSGAGIYNYNRYGTLIVRDCTFSANKSEGWGGGGMYNDSDSNSIVTNCVFIANSSERHGGGMYNWRSNTTITNCTFAQNLANNGNALACDSYLQQYPSNLEIADCIFWDGEKGIWNNDNSTIAITYSDVQGGWPGEGNIDSNPLFVDPGYWDANGTPDDANDDFWVDGDYHLLPGSPCIDAGDPNYIAEPNETDLDGRPRIIGGRIDMGAYETPILAEARILPRTINIASKGKWITAFIWLPEAYDVADIESDSILLEGQINTEQFSVDEQKQVVTAIFDREKVQGILSVGDIKLTITCQLTDGTYFEATDIVQVTDKGGWKSDK